MRGRYGGDPKPHPPASPSPYVVRSGVEEPQLLGVGALDALDVQLQDVLEARPQDVQ